MTKSIRTRQKYLRLKGSEKNGLENGHVKKRMKARNKLYHTFPNFRPSVSVKLRIAINKINKKIELALFFFFFFF